MRPGNTAAAAPSAAPTCGVFRRQDRGHLVRLVEGVDAELHQQRGRDAVGLPDDGAALVGGRREVRCAVPNLIQTMRSASISKTNCNRIIHFVSGSNGNS